MGDYENKIDNMEWSFSRLSTFEQCKYCFYLRYILNDKQLYPPDSNFWAENGSVVHETLEKIFKNEISADDAIGYYINNYEDIEYQAKKDTMRKTFELCCEYFSDSSFDWIDKFTILGVEKQVRFTIHGRKFLCYIDLLLERKDTGEIILLDHKSGNYFFKQDGTVKKQMLHSFTQYSKQMYLYCNAVKQEYGRFPDLIVWNHFKDGGKFSVIKFNPEDYKKTMEWFDSVIEDIKKEEDFEPTLDFFYCINLCSFRKTCEYRKKEYSIRVKY